MVPELPIITANGHSMPESAVQRCRSLTPPGAKLVAIEMVGPGLVQIAYRYHGVIRPNFLEVEL